MSQPRRYWTMDSAAESPPQPLRATWQICVGFAIVYLLGAELGHGLSFPDPPFAMFWPPAGIYLAVLLLVDRRDWGWIVLTSVLANFVSDVAFHARPLLCSLGFNLANTSGALVGALLTKNFVARPFTFSSLQRYLGFIVTAACAGPMVAATIGSLVAFAFLTNTGGAWSLSLWALWFIADAFGVLTFGTLIIAWFREPAGWRAEPSLPSWEPPLVLIAVAIFAAIGFSWPPNGSQLPIQFPMLVCPALVWAGLRLGRKGVLLASLIASIISILATGRGYGLYAHSGTTLFEKAAGLQIFILQVQALPFVLSIIVEETRRAEYLSNSQFKLLSGVLEGVDDGIVLKDREGRLHVVNPAAAALYQSTVDSMIGKTDADFFPPEVANLVREDDLRSMDNDQPLIREERWESPLGDMFFLTTRSPFHDDTGNVAGVIGIVRNITHLRHTSSALIISEGRFRTLANTTAAGIFETDPAGEVVYVNARWCEMTGLEPEEALGTGWVKALHPDDHDRVVTYWLDNVRDGQGDMSLEFQFRHPSGYIVWTHVVASPIRDELGRIRGYVGACIDITDRYLAEQTLRKTNEWLEQRVAERTCALQASNAQLQEEMTFRRDVEERLHEQQAQLARVSRVSTMGEMAATLAHELNQPLYAIRNYLNGLERRLANVDVPSFLPAALSELGAELDRAAEIVRRTRQFVGQGPPQTSPLNLNVLVAEAVGLVEHEAKRRGMKLDVQTTEGLPDCSVDPVALQQVIVNLIRNAFDAMEPDPQSDRTVTLQTAQQDGQLLLACSDTGLGIKPQDMPQIFQAFFTTKPDGLGMGLAISRSIMEAHGGSLTVEPRQPRGTTFCCFLPIPEAERYRKGIAAVDPTVVISSPVQAVV